MKRLVVSVCGALIFVPVAVMAQLPPPPTATVETDFRTDSIRLRSAELERIKRDSERPIIESTAERDVKFAIVKESFENIQRIQDAIVRTYKTGKVIDYSKIADYASQLNKNALRLDNDLFGVKPDIDGREKPPERTVQKSVRDLIIDLDGQIGNFVSSPVFRNTKVVEKKSSEETEKVLRSIIGLSFELSNESRKLK